MQQDFEDNCLSPKQGTDFFRPHSMISACHIPPPVRGALRRSVAAALQTASSHGTYSERQRHILDKTIPLSVRTGKN